MEYYYTGNLSLLKKSNSYQMEKSYSHCDSCVKTVIEKFIDRSDIGMKKYGTNLDRKDLSLLDWIQHAQEEHMDAILYLEKLKMEYLAK
jgi:hypothetical protein